MILIPVVDVELHPNPNFISSAIKSESSGNSDSHSSGNGYKATPVLESSILSSHSTCVVVLAL